MKSLLTAAINTLIAVQIIISVNDSRSQASPGGKYRRQGVDEESIGRDETDESVYTTWTIDVYPNPVLLPQYCRVSGLSSNVCDPDDVLKQREKRNLNTLIRRIGSDSKCYCSSCAIDKHGVSIGIAIARSIFRTYNVLPLNNTANFAQSLRKKWKLGICDNDILILLTTSDRLWYVAYGSVVREIFPSQSLERITEGTKASFASGRYYEGLVDMITQFHAELIALEQNSNVLSEAPTSEANTTVIVSFFFIALLFIVIFGLAVWYVVFTGRRKKAEQERQQSLPEESEGLQDKAREAAQDRETGNRSRESWLTKLFPRAQDDRSMARPEERKMKSSIEDQVEADEVDTAVSIEEVYKDTTVRVNQ